MKSNTEIRTEYTPCGLTAQGTWRPITVQRFTSKAAAERALKEHIEDCAANPRIFQGCKEYKVMQRRAIITTTEWEDV